MAKYTMELREVIRFTSEDEVKSWFMDYDLDDYLTDEQIAVINNHGIWSKEKLAQQIVDHFYMREIGLETIGLFKHQAKVYMRELMEYYLPEIYSASIEYDPLVNVNYSETYNASGSSTGNSTSQSSGSSLGVNSDTPQGQINKQEILQGKYASSTGASESENNGTSTSSGTTNDTYTKTIKGNSGVSATSQAMVKQFRDIIVSTNRNIIKDLNILFMGIY